MGWTQGVLWAHGEHCVDMGETQRGSVGWAAGDTEHESGRGDINRELSCSLWGDTEGDMVMLCRMAQGDGVPLCGGDRGHSDTLVGCCGSSWVLVRWADVWVPPWVMG